MSIELTRPAAVPKMSHRYLRMGKRRATFIADLSLEHGERGQIVEET
jgi:hypothetical protein